MMLEKTEAKHADYWCFVSGIPTEQRAHKKLNAQQGFCVLPSTFHPLGTDSIISLR